MIFGEIQLADISAGQLLTVDAAGFLTYTEGVQIDQTTGDVSVQFGVEMHVGNAWLGTETILGEGDSYTHDMLLYRATGVSGITPATSGSMIQTNVAMDFTTLDTSGTDIFNTGISGDAFYVGTDVIMTETGEYKQTPGLKFAQLVPISGGGMESEYWDGSKWKHLDFFIADAVEPYLGRGRDFGEAPGSFQMRYNSWIMVEDINVGFGFNEHLKWQKNKIGTGEISGEPDRYWTRFRVTNDLLTNPVMDQIKLHTNRTELNANGFQEFMGSARTLKHLPWKITDLESTGGGPTNASAGYSTNINVSIKENDIAPGESLAFHASPPPDMDTSTPVILRFGVITATGVAGTWDYTVRWTWATPDSSLYYDNLGSPSVHVNEQSMTIIGADIPSANTLTWYTHHIALPDAIASREGEAGDLIAISITRDIGGTIASNKDIGFMTLDAKYVSWCHGTRVGG